jgi:hypothetical protein
MNGVAGLNTRILGVNRDNTLTAALALGGKYILAQDDPDLAARAAAAGLTVVYRQSGDESLHIDPATFVAERAKNAPAAAYIHLTNELDPTPEQLSWTNEAIKYADRINRKVVVHNYSTGRSSLQWRDSAAVSRTAVSHGHAVGFHVYIYDTGVGQFEWLNLKRSIGGVWLCTEFGFAIDAHHGWRGTLSQDIYANFCNAWLQEFAAENIPVLLFSFDHWTHNEAGKAHGFGVNDAPTFLSALAEINTKYPLTEGTPVPPTPDMTPLGQYRLTAIPADYVNVRATPSTSGADLGDLFKGDVVTLFAPVVNGWVNVEKGALKGWTSLQNGAVVFTPVDAPPTTWTVRLDVPYVSQTSETAAKSNNDCGIACLLMQIHYWMTRHGLLAPSLPCVDDLVPYTPLGRTLNPPSGLTFAQIGQLARQLGFTTNYFQPATMDWIAQQLRDDKPVTVLVDYSVFKQGGAKIAHLAIVKGYNATNFLCADPYLAGDNYVVSRAQLENAMRSSPGNSVGFQAMVLAV